MVIDIQPANIMVQLPDESLINDYLKSTHVETQLHGSDVEYQVVKSHSLRNFYFEEGFDIMTLKIALSD